MYKLEIIGLSHPWAFRHIATSNISLPNSGVASNCYPQFFKEKRIIFIYNVSIDVCAFHIGIGFFYPKCTAMQCSFTLILKQKMVWPSCSVKCMLFMHVLTNFVPTTPFRTSFAKKSTNWYLWFISTTTVHHSWWWWWYVVAWW